jgi:hypothetical protein
MYVVLLDDSELRHREIVLALGDDHCLLEAFEVEEAKRFFGVSGIRVGMLLIDHDLGTAADGDDFARWLMNELDEEKLPASCVVISSNAYGAENIAAKLRARKIPTRCIPYSSSMVKQLAKELEPE